MPDTIVTASAPDAGFAIVAGITTDLVREAQRRHGLSPTAMAALANPRGIAAASGVIAQVLPGADESTVRALEERALAMPPITTSIDGGADVRALVRALAGETTLRSLRSVGVRFACLCSRERVAAALLALGANELRAIAGERDATQATCEFCRKAYAFDSGELSALVNRLETA